jgi:hypothetical protein
MFAFRESFKAICTYIQLTTPKLTKSAPNNRKTPEFSLSRIHASTTHDYELVQLANYGYRKHHTKHSQQCFLFPEEGGDYVAPESRARAASAPTVTMKSSQNPDSRRAVAVLSLYDIVSRNHDSGYSFDCDIIWRNPDSRSPLACDIMWRNPDSRYSSL